MKNTQRGFIMPLLLALIAILLVGGGAYVYVQNNQVNPPVTGDSTTPVPTVATSITVTYPNGGEKLEVNEQDSMPKGINFVIRWTSNNLTGTTNVYLISATDGSVCLLGSSPVKQGSFGSVLGVSFKCTNTSKLLTSGQYKVKLIADTQSPSSDLGVNDMSDNYFTLNIVSTNQVTSTAVPTTASEADEILAAAKSATPSDTYVRYNNNFYSRIEGTYNFIKVIGADVNTFEILRDSWGYAKDKNYVYYYGKTTSFDPKTFMLLGDYYAKDNVSVYFIREKMGADATTFSVLRDPSSLNSYSRFSKDKDRVYFQSKPIVMNPQELPLPDAKSFTLIDAAYAKDSSRVYYIAEYNSTTGMEVISGADAGTFTGLGSVISAKDVVNYAYAKDKSQVYFYNKILPGVDVGTFEFVGTTGCSDVSCAPIVTKDKQCIYLNNSKVLGTNGVCINSNTCTKATINSGCGVK